MRRKKKKRAKESVVIWRTVCQFPLLSFLSSPLLTPHSLTLSDVGYVKASQKKGRGREKKEMIAIIVGKKEASSCLDETKKRKADHDGKDVHQPSPPLPNARAS